MEHKLVYKLFEQFLTQCRWTEDKKTHLKQAKANGGETKGQNSLYIHNPNKANEGEAKVQKPLYVSSPNTFKNYAYKHLWHNDQI